MENNKVRVKIYGQDYTIAGEEPREHIIKVADYVDIKMRGVEKSIKTGSMSMTAVLAAVNIADDYFGAVNSVAELKKANDQLEKDVGHYVEMWEEAKRNFLQYKEDAQTIAARKDALLEVIEEKDKELAELRSMLEDAEMKAKKEIGAEMEKLQDKLKETENNYFDLQMENVQIKSELERFKKITV